jgi:hypothetical protein
MEIVITKEFLQDFFIGLDDTNIYHIDFKKFLTAQIKNINLVTNISDLEELEKLSEKNPLWELIIDRGLDNIDYKPNLINELQNHQLHQSGYPIKLFCVNIDKNACSSLTEKFGYEFLCFENIDERWKIYFSDREDYNLPIDSISNPRFDNWQKLQDFAHPINSIVIFDKYLFSELKQNGAQQWSTEDNLFQIFKNLIKDAENEIPLSVTIIIDHQHIKLAGVTNLGVQSNKLLFLKQKIESFFAQNYSKLKINISIIHYDKSKHSTEKEHGRGIYTNYYYIFIEQGINILNCSNSIINNSHVSFFFPLRYIYKNIALSKLRNFQTYIKDINNYVNSNPNPQDNRKNFICGNFDNRLIIDI